MEISITKLSKEDLQLFSRIWNQGIDAHLEAFTKSTHWYVEHKPEFCSRHHFDFHKEEIHILLRRLREVGTGHAIGWAEDIENLLEDTQE